MSARKLLIAAFYLVAAPAVHAATFYVATTGSDGNPGTLASPFLTGQKGISVMHPGDTLYLRAGTYGGFYLDGLNGNSAAWYTVKSFPGENAVIDMALGSGCSPYSNCGIHLLNSSFIDIENLEIVSSLLNGYNTCGPFDIDCQNASRPCDPSQLSCSSPTPGSDTYNQYANESGITIAGACCATTPVHDLILKNLKIHHIGGTGIQGGSGVSNDVSVWTYPNGSERWQILNNEIFQIGVRGFNQGYYTYIMTSDSLIKGNVFHDGSGSDGVRLGYTSPDGDWFNNNIIEDNIVYATGGVVWRNFAQNWMYSGNGFTLFGGFGNIFRNNMAYGNRGDGFYFLGTGSQNNRVYNNTAYGNGFPGFWSYASCPSGCKADQSHYRNNISYGNDFGTDAGGNYGGVNFSYSPGATPDAPVSNNLGFGSPIDPLFINPAGGNFQLQAGSPAIDKGVSLSEVANDMNGVPRPQGPAYDLGAYEFQGSSPPSPCDVNASGGSPDVVDVQLCVNQSLGVASCTADINQDGICNVIDVQRVVNSALGGQCVSP